MAMAVERFAQHRDRRVDDGEAGDGGQLAGQVEQHQLLVGHGSDWPGHRLLPGSGTPRPESGARWLSTVLGNGEGEGLFHAGEVELVSADDGFGSVSWVLGMPGQDPGAAPAQPTDAVRVQRAWCAAGSAVGLAGMTPSPVLAGRADAAGFLEQAPRVAEPAGVRQWWGVVVAAPAQPGRVVVQRSAALARRGLAFLERRP